MPVFPTLEAEAEAGGSGVQGYPITQGIKGQAVLLETLYQKSEANNLRVYKSQTTVIKPFCLQNKNPRFNVDSKTKQKQTVSVCGLDSRLWKTRYEITVSPASLSYCLPGLELEQPVETFYKSSYQGPILQRMSQSSAGPRPTHS